MPTNILYIHGFNSSPQSTKALQTQQYFKEYWPNVEVFVPDVAVSPNQAIALLTDIILSNQSNDWCLMGSSLGGFFATHLAEKFKLPAVLINPAIKPDELLAEYIGEQINPYSGKVLTVTAAHMYELKQLRVHEIVEKSRYYLLTQTGDEILDYRQGVALFAGCQQFIHQGGDHSFVNYQQMLPNIVKFFQIA